MPNLRGTYRLPLYRGKEAVNSGLSGIRTGDLWLVKVRISFFQWALGSRAILRLSGGRLWESLFLYNLCIARMAVPKLVLNGFYSYVDFTRASVFILSIRSNGRPKC
jgi:hypothetical protein